MPTPEAFLQQACWTYAQAVLPVDADFASVETKLGVDDFRRAAQRKAAGVVAGQPDAQLVWKGRIYFIELKAGASLSQAQRIRHMMLRAAGAEVYVLRSVAQLAALFRDLQIPLKHTSLTPEHRDAMWRARWEKQRAQAAQTRAVTKAADEEAGETGPRFKAPRRVVRRPKPGQAHRISMGMVR